MKLLKEIKNQEIPKDESRLKLREAARAVLFDENNLIPILFVGKYNYHKLPGGGIENSENKMRALERECLEEAGVKIQIAGELGMVLEYRSKWKLKQTSYCYYGKVISKGETDFTKEEQEQDFQLIWMSLDETIEKVKNDKPLNYEGSFIQERDLAFLEEMKKVQEINQ